MQKAAVIVKLRSAKLSTEGKVMTELEIGLDSEISGPVSYRRGGVQSAA